MLTSLELCQPNQKELLIPANLQAEILGHVPRPPQCTSLQGLVVSIRWYLGSLKGYPPSAGTASCTESPKPCQSSASHEPSKSEAQAAGMKLGTQNRETQELPGEPVAHNYGLL